MTTLVIERICAGYGGAPVLHDVSLTVGAGEVVALLGRNGAGKSTLLRSVVGAIGVTSGRVLLDGEPLAGPVHRRVRAGIAYVSETRDLIGSVTIEANLRAAARDLAPALEVFPELEPLRRRQIGLLSGGEQQMVALARAVLLEPRLLLVDELSLGLAPMVVDRLLQAVGRLATEGTAVLLVEQNAERALAASDRAVVLRKGAVALDVSSAGLRPDDPQLLRCYFGDDREVAA